MQINRIRVQHYSGCCVYLFRDYILLLSFMPGLGRPGFFIGRVFGAGGREKFALFAGACIFVALVNQSIKRHA